MISKEYRAMLKELHSKFPRWGTSAAKYGPIVAKMIDDLGARSVLDYGCGKGELFRNIPFSASMFANKVLFDEYDPGIDGKGCLPLRQFDLVCCFDVLEHIEPEHLDEVLKHLASLIAGVGYFIISTKEAKAVLPDGRNAHLIIKGEKWWAEKISPLFSAFCIDTISQRSELHVLVSHDPLANLAFDFENVKGMTKPKGLWMG